MKQGARIVGWFAALMLVCAPAALAGACDGVTGMYTEFVVECVRRTLMSAVAAYLTLFSAFMTPILAILATMATAFFGVRVLGGEQEILPKAYGFMIRTGVVLLLFYGIGLTQVALWPFAFMDEMVSWVLGGYSPWQQLDAFISKLFGMQSVQAGLIGLITASLFSSTVGGMLFIVAVFMIISLVMFIFRVVYSYLTAVVMLGFLLIIMPLVIPLALFQVMEARYVKKWLDLVLSVMLQPLLLFTFLKFFLVPFSFFIVNIYCALMTQDIDAYMSGAGVCPTEIAQCAGDVNCTTMPADISNEWRTSKPLFTWLVQGDPTWDRDAQAKLGLQPGVAAIQPFLNPLMGNALNVNIFNLPSVDFGDSTLARFQALILNFFALLLFAYIMSSLVGAIPQIADSIAGASTGIGFEELPFARNLGQGSDEARKKMQEALEEGRETRKRIAEQKERK